jgi:predicted DNA-binding transcriptional regulator AlpA
MKACRYLYHESAIFRQRRRHVINRHMPTTTRVPTVDERPLLVARETFGPLAMSDTTGYELIRLKKFPLPVRKVGGRWMVNTRDLRNYLGLDQND